MIYNLINALYYSFIFYIGYSVLYRVIEIKKYVKKSNKDGTYNESYKIMYSKHLKSNCIVTSTIMGIFNFADNYTNTIFSMAIGIVVILCLKPIFEKYYPKPKGNL